MKDLPIFNKGDKVTVNNKYIGLESMVGEIYTIRAGPAMCSDTWCYWLENVAGGIAADALEPLEQNNEEWFCQLSTKEKARFFACEFTVACDDYAYSNNKETWNEKYWLEWLKKEHK